MESLFDMMFSTPMKLEFIDKEFDFKLDPDHFIKWLEAEGENITGDYSMDVSSMCEYSCLYAAMLLDGVDLKGDLTIYYGKFGMFEHYWLGYSYEGQEYYIDLTLRQFVNDAPKVSVVKAINKRVSGCYSTFSEGIPIKDYVEGKQGFDFYVNPKTMEKPKYTINYGI